jgi:uncharacterized membrane protein YoaK (UPF0700 family)
MDLFRWAEEKSQSLTIWDIGVLKIYCVLFGVVVGAYVPTFVRDHVLWFAAAVIVLGGGFGYRWFTARTA